MKSALLGADPTDIAEIHTIMDRTLLNNTAAKAAIDIAKKYGKTCIVGCFYESKLAISAAASVVLARDNIESADLDSFFTFANPEVGVCGGFEVDKDVLTLSSKSGFGFDEYEF